MEESFSERASEKLMNIVENLKTLEEFLDFLRKNSPKASGLWAIHINSQKLR